MSLLQIHEPGQTPAPHADDVKTAIGIDLGTTHSVVSYLDDAGEICTVTDAQGKSIHPSIVSLGAEKIHSIKRHMTTAPAQVFAQGKTPVEISAEILRYLRNLAEIQLGHEVLNAVITVPAYFDDTARTATKDAAKLAGLNVLRLINEPTAAALAYGLDSQAEGVYAIYDLGGGTFDVSILRLQQGVFQVLATHGDVALGGDDFDDALSAQLQVASRKSREVKERLSFEESVEIDGQTITRDQFEAVIDPLIERTLDSCKQALADADLTVEDVDGVVLVGGSTRVPAVQRAVADLFDQPPLTNIDPDKVVAHGAGLQAHALTKGSNTLLLDVIPLSLGLETMGGLVEKVINRNSPIPTAARQEFTTYQDGQTAMLIHVLQGEREMVEQCRSLAKFTLKGIPPMVAGQARIAVTFTVDADGLLSVSATEETTGTEQTVEVKPSYGLSEEQMTQMLYDSMKFAKEDITARMTAEAKVEAERLVHDLNTAMKVSANLLDTTETKQLLTAVDNLQAAIASNNRDAIDAAHKHLEQIAHPFAQRRMDSAIGDALQGKSVENI